MSKRLVEKIYKYIAIVSYIYIPISLVILNSNKGLADKLTEVMILNCITVIVSAFILITLILIDILKRG